MNYPEYLKNAKKIKLSKHFTLFDVCNSQKAIQLGIDNTPSPQIIANAKLLIAKILDSVTIHYGILPDIDCLFRCPRLNNAVGGVANSKHQFGQAVDFTIIRHSLSEIVNYIRNNLDFDQLIWENGWIHVSYMEKGNRKEVLKRVHDKYIHI
jgi:zinc D-Ala-D-Ala carboxypeptidase